MGRALTALLGVALLAAVVGGEFSNTLELESVTTFYTCTEAFPAGFADPFARQACVAEDAPVTAIRYLVQPGQDDSEGGDKMVFYAFPPPFATQPINEDTSPDAGNNPCAYASATENCTAFTATDGTSGAITLQARASHVVRKYWLKKILAPNHAPYSYTEHNLLIPRINDDVHRCYNHCDGCGPGDGCGDGECDPTLVGNKGFSQLAGCAYINDFDTRSCDGTSTGRPGGIHQGAQQYSQIGTANGAASCGPRDTYLLLQQGNVSSSAADGSGPALAPPEACRSCMDIYTKVTRGEAFQQRGNDQPVWTAGGNGCQFTYKYTSNTPAITPVLHPTLCPVGVGHYSTYPGTTNDLHSHAAGATDAYSLEPYYYWCQSQCVGDGSYTQKNVYAMQQDTSQACSIGGFDFGSTPGSLQDFITPGGEEQFNYVQYLNAYLCSMNYDTCPERNFAHSVDEYHMPCCNSTFVEPSPGHTGGVFENRCGDPSKGDTPDKTISDSEACGGIAAEQVRNAAGYLTAACDAADSGESYCPDCASNYFMGASGSVQSGQIRDPSGANPKDPTYAHGWQCPGWSYDHLRPSISLTDTIQLAKCSTECQTDQFIRWQVDHNDNDCTDKGDTNCFAYAEEVTSERAIVELGYGACDVYQVVPSPIIEIAVEMTLTAADGSYKTTLLSNGDVASSIATVALDGVNFTYRLNEAFVRGGPGPQIGGLIVVCNNNIGGVRNSEEYCCKSEDMGGAPIQGACSTDGFYNPYNPEVDDPATYGDDLDISVEKPQDDTAFCTNGAHVGAVRSVFPHGFVPDGESVGLEVPQVNPWPQLVRKMMQTRAINKNAAVNEGANGGTLANEQYACHVPSHRYLGVLNCGFPVYWYYVSEDRKSSYGTNCGQVGVNNGFATQGTSSRLMCLQGGSSCTPAYGEPKFSVNGAPFYRTPCQELGDMVKTVANVSSPTSRQPLTCADHAKIPNAFDMPGFQYVTLDGDASTLYPNSWVHGEPGGLFLYQQLTTAGEENILIDVSTYTDSYYGGNTQSYTDGILVPGKANSTICFATANEQPGILVVGVVNTNSVQPGRYLVTLSCKNVETGDSLDGTPTPSEEFSPSGPSDILVDVGPAQTVYVSWDVTASGAVPNDTDTDPPNNANSSNIGIPTCVVDLKHGGGDFAQLYELTVSCVAIAATIAAPSRNSELDETIQKIATCKPYQFFCWLSRHGPIEEGEIVVMAMLFGLFGVILFIMGCRLTLAGASSYHAEQDVIKDYKQLETAKEERQAERTAAAVQRRNAMPPASSGRASESASSSSNAASLFPSATSLAY